MNTVPVEQLAVGAVIVLPNGKTRRVTAVDRYNDGSYVVVYADNTLHSWERGGWRQTIVDGLEKQLRPMRAGETVRCAA